MDKHIQIPVVDAGCAPWCDVRFLPRGPGAADHDINEANGTGRVRDGHALHPPATTTA